MNKDGFSEGDHPRDKSGRFTDKIVMYESASGGKVTKSYAGTPKEEAQNLSAAKVLADKKGWNVELRYNTPNRKSADAKINGEDWEIKTNYTPTASAVDSAIKNAKGQARNVILHIQSDIETKDAVNAVKWRLARKNHYDKVLIITKGNALISIVRKEE